jgi:hypothetical protein
VVCSGLLRLFVGEFASSSREKALYPSSVFVLVLVSEVLLDCFSGVHTVQARLNEACVGRVEKSVRWEFLEDLVV